MGIASLVLGVLTFTGVCVSLIPLLNILNCFTLPLALIGAALGVGELLSKNDRSKGMAVAGLVLCGLALLIGGVRALISLFTTGGIL